MNRTDICNMALAAISREPIKSLDEESTEAQQAAIFYEHTRKRLLRMYPWGFARKVDKLAELNLTIPGWDYVYGYPADCLLVNFVFDENHAPLKEMERQDYQIVTTTGNNKAIASNTEKAWAEYIYDAKNTEVFSEEFIEALVRMMAANLSLQLTGNSELFNLNMQLAQQAASLGTLQNIREEERRTNWPRKYEQARFS